MLIDGSQGGFSEFYIIFFIHYNSIHLSSIVEWNSMATMAFNQFNKGIDMYNNVMVNEKLTTCL